MSSSSIWTQMISCENQLEQLRNVKSQYSTLLYKLNSISGKLRQAVANLRDASSQLMQSFQLDGKIADKGATEDAANNIQLLYDNLHDKIIPAIKDQIKSLGGQIESLNRDVTRLERDYRAAKTAEETEKKTVKNEVKVNRNRNRNSTIREVRF